MPQRPLLLLGWIAILLLSLWLRLNNLDVLPIHADEATGARILAKQLEGEGYTFNPKHFHGPMLNALTAPIAHLRNETNWKELSITTLRLGSVLTGTLIVLTPLLWLRQIRPPGALIAGAFLATSPLLIYYNRIYIHESLLTLLGMLALAAIFRLIKKPSLSNGFLAGLCVGLMFATKETFVISVIAWGIAMSLCIYVFQQPTLKPNAYLKPLILFGISALLVSGVIYTNGLRDLTGFRDACLTFFLYETTPGHDKAAHYYLHLLLWPKQLLGQWWTEATVAFFALLALALAFINRHSSSKSLLFIALAAFMHLLIYSLISYKTPWLMLLPWAHLCLLAGATFVTVEKANPASRYAMVLALIGALSYQTTQSLHATGRLANDHRNPYAYVPTTRDPKKIATFLHAIHSLEDAPAVEPIAIVGKAYWPLPWYLRDFETIGYWPQPIPKLSDYPVILAMLDQINDCDKRLSQSHTKLPRGLRNNVSIALYLRDDLWKRWMQSPDP